MGTRRKDWTLGQESFDRLLGLLDSDRERAGLQYERIRQKLMKFFEWRGCAMPDEYVDKTLDRVAVRIKDGIELRSSDPYAYCHAVALNLLHEYRRDPSAGLQSMSDGSFREGAHPPASQSTTSFDWPAERRLECLDNCLRTVSAENRALLLEYHEQRGRARQRLADRLDMPLNALRIRMFRLRVTLEDCVVACLDRAAVDDGPKYRSGFGH